MTSNRRIIQTQSKRKYSTLGEHNLNILKSFWKRGMTSYRDEKKKELVRQAAFETGMSENQVKDWIGNYRRRQTGKKYPKYCGLKRKSPNGYNLFVSEYVKKEIANGTPRLVALRSASKAWQIKKSSGESSVYFKKAEEMRLPTAEEMTDTQKKIAITRLITEINEKIEALEKLGVEGMAMFVVPSTGKVYQLSNNSGIQYVQINGTEAQYKEALTNGETNVNSRSRVRLREDVQKLFNDSFFSATGRSRVSYREVDSGRWKVTGLPDGIKFQRPSAYGIYTLKEILNNKQKITFSECLDGRAKKESPNVKEDQESLNVEEREEILNGKREEESLNGIEESESLNGIEEEEILNGIKEEIDIIGGSDEEEDIIGGSEEEGLPIQEVTDLEQLCGSVGVDIQLPDGETNVNGRSKVRLREDVQKLFNDSFFSATGRSRVSYREVDSGRWKVTGLPDGIKFQRPSSYGIYTLKTILNNKQKITFSECLDGRAKKVSHNVKVNGEILNGKGEEESSNGIKKEEILNGIEEEIDIIAGSEEVENIIEGSEEEGLPIQEVTDLEQLCGSVGVDI